MAISDNYQPTFDLGNGVTTNFSAPWRVLDLDYLVVIFQNVATGVQTVQTTGFTAQILSNGSVQVSFSVAPTSSNYVILARNITIDQGDPYTTAKGFQGFTLEDSLDKLTGIDQDQQDQIDRSLKFPTGSLAVGALPNPIDQAALIWVGTSGAIGNGPSVGDIAGAATAASTAVAAAATATTASTAAVNALNSAAYYKAVMTGTGNAQVLTTGLATVLTAGQKFRYLITATSSLTNPTAAIDGQAAVTIFKGGAAGLAALSAGDMVVGTEAELYVIDSTHLELLNPYVPASVASAVQLGSNIVMTNGTLVASVTGNAVTVALKTLAGANPSTADPVMIAFRDSTLTSGAPVVITITAATSATMSSGSTGGASNATPFRFWVVAFNDAGTVRLGIVNCSTSTQIYPLNEGVLASSTAEGGAGAADSPGVIYTGVAVTSKAFRILGYMDWGSGLTTAGTYATAPTEVQLFGPGIKRPGEVVQIIQMQTSTDTPTSVNGQGNRVITTMAQAITPTASPNLIRVHGVGGLFSTSVSSSANAVIYRNNTQVVTNAIQMYPQSFYISGLSMLGLDKPGTTASTTYAAYLWSSGGTNVEFLPSGVGGQTGTLVLEEIQG